METPLDLTNWKRRAHFELFRGYESPFFGLTAAVDVTALAARCREPGGPSFSLATFFLSLKAVNEIEELRYRLRGDGVAVHAVVHGGTTVLRPDGTFGFGYFEYRRPYAAFAAAAEPALAAAREAAGLLVAVGRDDLVHYSVIPWVAFTGFLHARRFGTADSVPKIVFGKRHEEGGRIRLPVSVEAHHALADGLHVGRFFERFEQLAAGEP